MGSEGLRKLSIPMAKKLAIAFGIVFVLIGILGWVPNPLVGMGALFDTNHAHDLVHLVFGLILLVVGFLASKHAALALKALGVVYLLIAVLGFMLAQDGGLLLGLVATNMADHLLHVVLGVVLLVAGFIAHDDTEAPAAMASPMPMPESPMASTPPAGGM
jgi:primosomal replication protein N